MRFLLLIVVLFGILLGGASKVQAYPTIPCRYASNWDGFYGPLCYGTMTSTGCNTGITYYIYYWAVNDQGYNTGFRNHVMGRMFLMGSWDTTCYDYSPWNPSTWNGDTYIWNDVTTNGGRDNRVLKVQHQDPANSQNWLHYHSIDGNYFWKEW
jgi:hypothetical protein